MEEYTEDLEEVPEQDPLPVRPPVHKGRPRRPPPAISPIRRDMAEQRSDVEVENGEQASVDEQSSSQDAHLIDIDHVSLNSLLHYHIH